MTMRRGQTLKKQSVDLGIPTLEDINAPEQGWENLGK